MGFLDRFLGRRPHQQAGTGVPEAGPGQDRDPDSVALDRYRYLLRTAPPERIEQAHAEAFERLTPAQRRQVLQELSHDAPEHERPQDDSPSALARAATRAEMRHPGTLERSFGARGPGLGGVLAGSLLASVAGAFVGTAVAQQILGDAGDVTGADDMDGDGPPGDAEEPRFGEEFASGSDFGGDFDGGFGDF